MQPSFYKRPLPSFLIPFSSPQGKELFKEVLGNKGVMEGYWTLAEQFQTQSEPAYCGLAALSMVLNALQIDPKRFWKVPWRWFSEDLLDCCAPLDEVKKNGITFHEFACLARCNGAEVKSYRATETTEKQFRERLKSTCSGEGSYLVVNFSRPLLGQTGDGHFAAIAGYHQERDLALILDTAKFKYPAFWCPVSLLFEAMKPVDKITNSPRGYFVLSKSLDNCEATTCTMKNFTRFRMASEKIQTLLKETHPESQEEVIHLILKHFVDELGAVTGHISEFLSQEIATTQLYEILVPIVNKYSDLRSINPIQAAVFFIAAPSQFFKSLSPTLRREFHALRDLESLSINLNKEITHIRYHLLSITQKHCGTEHSCQK